MNGKDDVSAVTRERVRETASALGYRVDSVGRALASQRTQLVGVAVGDNAGHRDLSLMFFGKVLAAISRRLAGSGYEPLLLQNGQAARQHRFDAAIVIGVDEDDALVRDLAAQGLPLVGVDVRCRGASTAFVGSDHAGGVQLALAHLQAMGHRRIAHVAGALNTLAGAERLQAFQRETARPGWDQPSEYLRYGDFSSASGYREACALLALEQPPTAIVAGSDLMALAALHAIWESGRRPGRDVAVVGFDDSQVAQVVPGGLTSVRQPLEQVAVELIKALEGLLSTPPVAGPGVLLSPTLAVRLSSG
jgi:LacI family transcriptional regulator